MRAPARATTSTSSTAYHLQPPFHAFWWWWGFWALFPFVFALPLPMLTAYGGWLFNLIWMPPFLWSAVRPIRVWMQRPRPMWLFFLLLLGVPLLLFGSVSALLVLMGS